MSFDHIKMDILPNDFIYRANYEKCIALRISTIPYRKKCINKTETPFANTNKTQLMGWGLVFVVTSSFITY